MYSPIYLSRHVTHLLHILYKMRVIGVRFHRVQGRYTSVDPRWISVSVEDSDIRHFVEIVPPMESDI